MKFKKQRVPQCSVESSLAKPFIHISFSIEHASAVFLVAHDRHFSEKRKTTEHGHRMRTPPKIRYRYLALTIREAAKWISLYKALFLADTRTWTGFTEHSYGKKQPLCWLGENEISLLACHAFPLVSFYSPFFQRPNLLRTRT